MLERKKEIERERRRENQRKYERHGVTRECNAAHPQRNSTRIVLKITKR